MDMSPIPPRSSTPENHSTTTASPWVLPVSGAVVLGALGHLLLKCGLTHTTYSERYEHIVGPQFFTLALVLGVLMYSGGSALWIFAVSRREISFLYPLSSLTYVFVAFGGKVFFHEVVHPSHWAGIGVVMVGIALLNRSDGGRRP